MKSNHVCVCVCERERERHERHLTVELHNFQLLSLPLWPLALELPVDCKEIKPVTPKGRQSWIFIGRTDAEAEAPILWPPDEKNWLTGKDPDAGKDRRQEEKGTTEDEMLGWHHWLNGHGFEQAPGVGEDREAWSAVVLEVAKSNITERLNWTDPALNLG